MLIYGETEADQRKILIRRMNDRTQELVDFDGALEFLFAEMESDNG